MCLFFVGVVGGVGEIESGGSVDVVLRGDGCEWELAVGVKFCMSGVAFALWFCVLFVVFVLRCGVDADFVMRWSRWGGCV